MIEIEKIKQGKGADGLVHKYFTTWKNYINFNRTKLVYNT